MDDSRKDRFRPDRKPDGEPGNTPDLSPPGADADDDDVFSRLNAPAQQPSETASSDSEPPFVVDQADLMGDEEKKGPSKAATFVAFAVVVMAVLGMLMTAAAVKLYFERDDMLGALDTSVGKLTTVYAGSEASDTSKRRIAWLQNTLKDGDYAQAQKAIEALGMPEIDRPSAVESPLEDPERPDSAGDSGGANGREGPPSPSDDPNLPIPAQAFFEQHPELWKGFFAFSVAIRQMQEQDVETSDLRKLRAEMVEAAAEGDAQRVESLLNDAGEAFEQQAPNRLPGSLREKLEQFQTGIQRAQQERLDVRAAVQLAQKSEQAARQGDIERAERLMNRAIAALENAPRMRMPSRPPGAAAQRQAPQMGPQIGLIRYVADLTAKVMRAEERDLTQVWESINIAAGAIREKNADQIREILSEAKEALHDIGDRRRDMSAAIAEAQEHVRQRRPSPEETDRPEEDPDAQARQRQRAIVGRVAGILEQVRDMPQEEFEANRAEIAQAVLQAMTAPMQMPAEQQRLRLADLPPEERVRKKMELAGKMYLRIKEETDLDRGELDETFSEARDLIAEHEYEKAEELVDEGVKMMRKMARGLGPAEDEPADENGYGPQLQFDRPSPGLELQPDMGEPQPSATPGSGTAEPPVPATPPADTPDATDGGTEQ